MMAKPDGRLYRVVAFVSALTALLCVSSFAVAARAGDDAVAVVQRDLALNHLGRYMSPSGACHAVVRAGWEGFPTQECTYTASSGVALHVIVLNADDAQLARWLVTACQDAGVKNVVPCAERLDLVTTCQSGAQFPVAGYVDEGEIFTFRDGVTARIGNLPSTVVAPVDVAADEATVFDAAPSQAKTYARIGSTTREEFAAFVGQPVATFAGLAWIATVRAEYQRAWGNDRNRLLSARVAADPAVYDVSAWGAGFDRFCLDVAGCPPEVGDPPRCGRNWKPWPSNS